MNTKHTPGPWTVQPDWLGPTWGGRVYNEALDLIAEVEELNDARLIAAAPDLLEACKAAAHFIHNGIALGFIRMPDADTPDTAHGTPPMLAAAIAKATA